MGTPQPPTKLMNITVTLDPCEHFEDDVVMYEKYMPSLIAHCRMISDHFKLWAEYTQNGVIHFHACIAVTKPKQTPCAYKRMHGLAGFTKITKVIPTQKDYNTSWNYDDNTTKHGSFTHPCLPTVLTELYFRKDINKAIDKRLNPPTSNILSQLNICHIATINKENAPSAKGM